MTDPFAVAERLAPVPTSRDQATRDAWTRYHAATALAAFTTLIDELFNSQPDKRPNIARLVELGVASTHAAAALIATPDDAPELLWQLTPEAGALNGEWEDWLADTLDRLGVNPADINPAYDAGDFRSPSQAVTDSGGPR